MLQDETVRYPSNKDNNFYIYLKKIKKTKEDMLLWTHYKQKNVGLK